MAAVMLVGERAATGDRRQASDRQAQCLLMCVTIPNEQTATRTRILDWGDQARASLCLCLPLSPTTSHVDTASPYWSACDTMPPSGRSRAGGDSGDSDAYNPTDNPTSDGSERESEDLSPVEDFPVGQRKRQPEKKVAPPKKRLRLTRLARSSARSSSGPVINAPLQARNWGPLRLVASKHTANLNKWLDVRETLSVTEEVVPSPLSAIGSHLTPLGELPDMPGRRYKYEVELVELPINWDPQDKKGDSRTFNRMPLAAQRSDLRRYNKKIKTWRIHVWNDASPKDQQKKLRLYPEVQIIDSMEQKLWLGKIKTQKRPTYSVPPPIVEPYKTIRLGGPLDINVCPTDSAAARVAAEACRLLNKYPLEIDPAEFPETVRPGRGKTCAMRTLIELQAMLKIKEQFDFRTMRYIFQSTVQESSAYCLKPPVVVNTYKDSRLLYEVNFPTFTLQDISNNSGRWTRITFTEGVYTEEIIDALPDPPSWWGFEYTATALPKGQETLIPVAKMVKLANYVAWQSFGYVGTRDAMLLAPRTLVDGSRARSTHLAGPFLGKQIFNVQAHGGGARFRLSTTVAKTISGSVPEFLTSLRPAVYAMALQSMYRVFLQGKGILRAIEEFAIALDELRLRKSILSTKTYCACGPHLEQKRKTAHFCMLCLSLQICSEMSWTVDNRLVCNSHFKNGPPPQYEYMEHKIRAACVQLEQGSLAPEVRAVIKAALCKDVLSDNRFKDVYNGIRAEDHPEYGIASSVDAIYPLWMDNDSFYVHHEDNVGITTEFANCMKGDDLPLVLASAAHALDAKAEGEYLENIELMFDHYSRIRTIIPYGKDDRMKYASAQPPEWWLSYLKMMRSGVFDGSPPIYDRDWRTQSITLSPWSDQDIARLDKICVEIEHDPTINPKGLRLPRGPPSAGRAGAPWLFNSKHMFKNHGWDYNGCLFQERFTRMDTACDLANDHENESPETLFLTCVVLWFLLDGGKDEVLGLRMTVFRRHALRFSIGRALHVEPGSIMVTGWKAKHPTSLADYDNARRTITMESWIMNRGKAAYSTEPAGVAAWTEVIRHFPRTSKFWDTYPPKQGSKPIEWPSDWRAIRFAVDPMKPIVDDEPISDGEDEYGFDIRDFDAAEDNDGLDTSGLDPAFVGSQSLPMTMAKLTEDNKFLLSLAEHLPEDALERYNEVISTWQAYIAKGLPESAPDDQPDPEATPPASGGHTTSDAPPPASGGHSTSDAPSSAPSGKPGSDATYRRSLFIAAIIDLLTIHDFQNPFDIEALSMWTLQGWQQINEGIDRVFTEAEIVSFCVALHDQGHLKHLPGENFFIYKV
ncbi:hypothetical protein NX059_001000 [Plenodomus lindquistii]|nr:hypothetical protein NX059_001000 [Plenodomus lindquistii]